MRRSPNNNSHKSLKLDNSVEHLPSRSTFTPSNFNKSMERPFSQLSQTLQDQTGGEEEDRPFYQIWLNSRLNRLKPEVLLSNRSFLWSFGDNTKRALAVQNKLPMCELPDLAAGSKLEINEGVIIQVASGQEHSAAVTDTGVVMVCGHNQHQKLGLEGKDILATVTKFTPVKLLANYKIA